jgi:hypothetical protein
MHMAKKAKKVVKKAATKKVVKKSATKDVVTISVANLCRTNEIDPKKGRAKLRKQGWSAKGKTYPPIEVGSTRYVEACEILGIE